MQCALCPNKAVKGCEIINERKEKLQVCKECLDSYIQYKDYEKRYNAGKDL